MKREIKFRAFFNNEMVMINTLYLSVVIGEMRGANSLDIDGNLGICPIMQYTGLKDKNGVEIYEGDIITFTRGIGNWTGKTLTTTHKVYYSDIICAFVLKGKGEYIKLRRLENRYIYEVIGNIYENEDLLTQNP